MLHFIFELFPKVLEMQIFNVSKFVLVVDRPRKTLTSSISEQLSYLGADLIFRVFVGITDRLQCILQILTTIIAYLPFSHSLKIQREVSQHPIKIGKALGYLSISLIIRLHPYILADPQHIGHVLECLFVDMPQSIHNRILTSYR